MNEIASVGDKSGCSGCTRFPVPVHVHITLEQAQEGGDISRVLYVQLNALGNTDRTIYPACRWMETRTSMASRRVRDQFLLEWRRVCEAWTRSGIRPRTCFKDQ